MYTKDQNHTKHFAHHGNDIQQDFRRVREKARETRDALSQTAFDVKHKASEMWNQSFYDIRGKTMEMQDNVVTYVKANPVKTIGYALLAGLILSSLIRK